ncbi:MAG: hypothetical protein DME25_08125 [Verrucomicrobia bacterium]|nr:MAG: hypothetical protein DME25_08125 [Verrucomicrobiota bacterium]
MSGHQKYQGSKRLVPVMWQESAWTVRVKGLDGLNGLIKLIELNGARGPQVFLGACEQIGPMQYGSKGLRQRRTAAGSPRYGSFQPNL